MNDVDPIQKEKTIFQKIRERFTKKQNLIITTSNPYTNKPCNYVTSKEYEAYQKNLVNFGEAVRKAGVTTNEIRGILNLPRLEEKEVRTYADGQEIISLYADGEEVYRIKK